MPSLQHRLATTVIPRLRRVSEVVDPEQERRSVLAAQARSVTASATHPVRGCDVRRLDRFGMEVYDVRVSGTAPGRTVLYVHGGGFVGTLDRFHWRYAAALARRLGVRVVLPAYPLAPRHTWRDALPLLVALFEEVAIESPQGVVLMGDSAGGALALVLAQQLTQQRPGPDPTHLVLLSPWVDLSGSTPGTAAASARDPWLIMSKMNLYASWWAGGADQVTRPEASPLWGPMPGLPPMLVFCGTRDTLFPQARALVTRAREEGVEVTYHEEPGLLHVYPILPIPEARRAHRQLAAFL